VRQGRRLAATDDPAAPRPARADAAPPREPPRGGKLTYKLQRELDELPGRIEALEAELATLEATVASPDFYAQGYAAVEPVLVAVENTRARLDAALARWDALETLQRETAR
jgi:ATP-binding cassette subfamily F protein uup